MVFFDVPRGGHSHNILRADGPRPHLAATHLGRGRSCIVRAVYLEGFGRHRVWHSVYRLPYGVPRNQDAQRQSAIAERRPAALDRIAHRSHDGGWWKCSLLIQVVRRRGCPTCVETAPNGGRLPCSFCDHLSHCGDIQRQIRSARDFRASKNAQCLEGR
jgi:hypothetical protein